MPISSINLQHLLREIDSMKRKLSAWAPVEDELWWPYFRLEWNFHTALLGGHALQRAEAALLQHGEIMAGLEEAGAAIRGHDAAIHRIRSLSEERNVLLDLADVQELQGMLLEQEKCRWRQEDRPVALPGAAPFHPVSADSIPAQMEELLGWCQRYAFDTHPVLLATEWYLGIQRIQPFDRGNGRLARLLMNFHLLRHGYPPVIFTEDSRGQLMPALTAALHEEDAALAGYIARRLILSLDWLLDRLRERSFGDSADWESELSALERQLSPRETNAQRTPMLLRQRLHDSLIPLVELTLQKTGRIDRLYGKTQRALHIYFDNQLQKTIPESGRYFFETRDDDALEHLQEMDLILRWNNARYHNALGYDLSLNLQFRFGAHHYEIIGPEYQCLLSKNYDLPLLQAEQDFVQEEIGKFLIEKLKT